jgi:hypothetical protein
MPMMNRQVIFTEITGTMADFMAHWSEQIEAKWAEHGQGQVESVSLSTAARGGELIYSSVTLILVPLEND